MVRLCESLGTRASLFGQYKSSYRLWEFCTSAVRVGYHLLCSITKYQWIFFSISSNWNSFDPLRRQLQIINVFWISGKGGIVEKNYALNSYVFCPLSRESLNCTFVVQNYGPKSEIGSIRAALSKYWKNAV